MGWKSFSFIGLSILATGQTLATSNCQEIFPYPLMNELIIFTIGEVISSANALMNFTGMF